MSDGDGVSSTGGRSSGRVALGLAVLAVHRLAAVPRSAAIIAGLRNPRSLALAAVRQARTLVREGVEEAVDRVGQRAATQLLDALVPHLVQSVAPRVIDGLLPHLESTVMPQLVEAAIPLVRERVIPVVIEDLTDSPLVKELVLEQSRGVASHTADQLRDATAKADDRVEDMVRGFVHGNRGP
jgi:hypothetical protein